MACWTRARVASVTCGWPCTTFETVFTETPARSATCRSPTRSSLPLPSTPRRVASRCSGPVLPSRSPKGNGPVAPLTPDRYNDVNLRADSLSRALEQPGWHSAHDGLLAGARPPLRAGGDRPAAVRFLRRAHGPVRLHRHLRAGPPDRRRGRLPR